MIVRPGSDSPTKTIVIIGAQRGGTSMVAGVARELGVNLGRNLGNNHEDPEFITEDLYEIRRVVARRNADNDVWGWKMPHSSLYIAGLLPEIRDPFVIVVFRNLMAVVESHMKRSGADFATAFEVAAEREAQVAATVPAIKCPLMVVNYDKAIRKPDTLVDQLCAFLHLQPSDNGRQRALEMINPKRGYARTRTEDWTARVSQAASFDIGSKIDAGAKLSSEGLDLSGAWPLRDGDRPHLVFDEMPGFQRVYLSVVHRGEPDAIGLCVNTGDGYTDGLTDRVHLLPGRNVLTIEAERINGVAIFPEFDGTMSNIGDVRVLTDRSKRPNLLKFVLGKGPS